MRDDAGFLGLGDVGGDGFRVDRGWIDIEAVARFKDLSNDQADGERQCRDDFEVDKRLQTDTADRSEEHTSELQSRQYLVCRLLLEKKKQPHTRPPHQNPRKQTQPLPTNTK